MSENKDSYIMNEEIKYLTRRLSRVVKDTGIEMEVSLTVSDEDFKKLHIEWREKTDTRISNYNLMEWKLWIIIERENRLSDALKSLIPNQPSDDSTK